MPNLKSFACELINTILLRMNNVLAKTPVWTGVLETSGNIWNRYTYNPYYLIINESQNINDANNLRVLSFL